MAKVLYFNDGWILQRWGDLLAAHCDGGDVHYHINYQHALKHPKPCRIRGAYFTHVEDGRYATASKELDFCVAMCEASAAVCRKHNPNTFMIHPPLDLGAFDIRLRVGFAGRRYKTGRKGDSTLKWVDGLDFVEFVDADGGLEPADMPAWYRNLDVVLVASEREGGPMCIPEALACGVPVVSTPVGLALELDDGKHVRVWRTRDELLGHLHSFYGEKVERRRRVLGFDQQRFIDSHLELFNAICES